MRARALPLLPLLACVTACGGDDRLGGPVGARDADAADAGDGGHDAGPLASIAFGPCEMDDLAAVNAECAHVSVPARWDSPSGEHMAVFVWRVRQPGATRQLWGLAGGPGQASWSFHRLLLDTPTSEPLSHYATDVDIYGVDARGTGNSGLLEEAPADVDIASRYSYTEVARDLDALVRATRGSQQVFIYAGSAGTLWAQRYLQVTASPPDGVILDSPLEPGTGLWPRPFDRQFDEVGQKLMELCAADSTCAEKLGPDPWARLGDLYDAIGAGHCPAAQAGGLAREGLRAKLGAIVDQRGVRDAIPAFVYRFLRCDPADVGPLLHFKDQAGVVPPSGPNGTSLQVLLLVGTSEIYETPPPSLDDVQENLAGLRVTQALGPLFANAYAALPRYPEDRYARTVPDTAVPILVMAGELDPRTPPRYAEALSGRLRGPHHAVETPQGAHGQLRGGRIASTKEHCGTRIVLEFMGAPLEAPDDSCMSDIERIAFAGDPDRAAEYFGAAHFWEN